jgi:hypothetical protein
MKKLITLFFCSFTLTGFAQNILVLGDSHSAGPFGSELHRLLSIEYNQVVTLGHASSAALHWVDNKAYQLGGGVFDQMSIEQKQYLNPNPTDWRVKVAVPKLESVLANNAYYAQWKTIAKKDLKADIVVIELGANDAKTIADDSGNIIHNGYQIRLKAIQTMIDQVIESGAKCIWIGPPHGIKKTDKNQAALYRFLVEAIDGRCPMFNSNHYKATGCDGVHFSCSSQAPKARAWASEAFSFIQNNI